MTDKPVTTPWQRVLAERIADRLFTNGFGDMATRIALRSREEKDLGGWSKHAAIDQIMEALADDR